VELSVPGVEEIKWNDLIFDHLALSNNKKEIVRSLVLSFMHEAKRDAEPFDDFVKGKGRGLVLNLYGMFDFVDTCR
jgi:hypothetical protein